MCYSRVRYQESTRESPFFLVYGRDPKLPTPAVLNPQKTRATMDLHEYGIELHSRMSAAWELARQNLLGLRSGRKLYMIGGVDQRGSMRERGSCF